MATKTDSFIGLLRETYAIQAANLRATGDEFDALWYEALIEELNEYVDLSEKDAIQASQDLLVERQERSQYSLLSDREGEALLTFEWIKSQWMTRQ